MLGSWELAVQLMYSSRKCCRYSTDTHSSAKTTHARTVHF